MKAKELLFRKVEKEKCKIKQSFTSEKEASDKMVKYWNKGAHNLIRPYRCPWCKMFHLTSRDKIVRPYSKRVITDDDSVENLGTYLAKSA